MSVNVDAIEECFYVPGRPGIEDVVDHRTGLGRFSKKSLASLQEEKPELVRGNFNEVVAQQAAYWRCPPKRITQEIFEEALNCLPPVDWAMGGSEDSFKISEPTSGTVHAIYALVDGQHWMLEDEVTLQHSDIIRMCREAAEAGKETDHG